MRKPCIHTRAADLPVATGHSRHTQAAKGNTGVPPLLASGHPDRCKSLVGRSAPLDQGLRMKCGNKHEKYGLLFNFYTQVVCDPICPRLQPGINSQFPVELL